MSDNYTANATGSVTFGADEVTDATLGAVKVPFGKIMSGALDSTNKWTIDNSGAGVVIGTVSLGSNPTVTVANTISTVSLGLNPTINGGTVSIGNTPNVTVLGTVSLGANPNVNLASNSNPIGSVTQGTTPWTTLGTVSLGSSPTVQGTVSVAALPTISVGVMPSITVGTVSIGNTVNVLGTVSTTVSVGTVSVANFPASTTVIGTVSLGSNPTVTTQATVSIGNTPTVTSNAGTGTRTVLGTVSLGSNPTVTGTISIGNTPVVSGTISVGNLSSALATVSIGTGRGDDTNSIYAGATAITPQFASLMATASGATNLIASVSNQRIRVLSYAFTMASNSQVNVKFQSGSTDITGLMAFNGGGISVPYSPAGHFQTASNSNLNINLSGNVTIGGHITYITGV